MTKLSSITINKKAVILIKVFLVLLATGFSTLVFGLFLPFALLALNILPSLGVAGVIYLFAGGVFGLLLGSISTSLSLFNSDKIATRYYILLMICLAGLSIIYLISYISFPGAYSHI